MLPDLERWLAYFKRNAVDNDGINWDVDNHLTDEEHGRIARSVAAFQLGEYSEGRGLMKFAKAYADEQGDRNLIEITRLFVSEEQNHAGLLETFMSQHDIPVIKKNWTDTVFRKLRKNVGYEISITILITAEIIALTYYRALAQCTGSVLLSSVCRKILNDEKAHVQYESGLINYIRSGHSPVRRGLVIAAHRFFYFGTLLVVYFEHRQVLRPGGYDLFGFWRSCWRFFNASFGGRAGIIPRPVTLEPHNSAWRSNFESESARLRGLLGVLTENIQHIGSTSIPGIWAKPIVDILIEAESLAEVDERTPAMVRQGYEAKGEFGIPGRRLFIKDDVNGTRQFNIHTFLAGSEGVERHTAFRDYLIAHDAIAQQYSDLKRKLVATGATDIEDYMDGKDAYIKETEKKAVAWVLSR